MSKDKTPEGPPLPPEPPSPEEQAAMEALVGPKELTREDIIQRLHDRFGIEKDELDTMYPTDEGLKAFYAEAKTVNEIGNDASEGEDDEEEKMPVAKYKLTPENKASLRFIKRQESKANKALVKKLPDAKDEKAKAAFDAAGSNLPEGERVGYDDAMRLIRESMGETDEK